MPINRQTSSSSPVVIAAMTAAKKQKKRYPGESKEFVEEMRFMAMKLHTKEQAKEGEKETKAVSSLHLLNKPLSQVVILTVVEHHSCIVPWQIVSQKTGAVVKFVMLNEDEVPNIEKMREMISSKTKTLGCSSRFKSSWRVKVKFKVLKSL